MHDPIDRALAALRSKGLPIRPIGPEKWKAHCPAHNDRKRSLSVSRGDNGGVVFKCHKGCAFEAIIAALGMTRADTFPRQARDPATPRDTAEPRDPWEEAVARMERDIGGERVATYHYNHVDGTEAFRKVRFATANGKEYRPFHLAPGGKWRAGYCPGKLPLYGLAGVARADRVAVVEGEKCAVLAARLGLAAVTSASGANNAARTDWTPLAGKEVWIVPDCDAAGEGYAETLIEIFGTLDPIPAARVVRLPGLAEKEDIEQWLGRLPADWTAERRREAFEDIADGAELVLSPGRPILRVYSEPPPPEEPRRPKGRPRKLDAAADWLRSLLSAGPIPSTEVYARGPALGYSGRTIDRARRTVGTESFPRNGQYWIRLMDGGQVAQPTPTIHPAPASHCESGPPKIRSAKNRSASSTVRNQGNSLGPHDRHEPILMECPAVGACMAGTVAPSAKPAPGVPSAPAVDPTPPAAGCTAADPPAVDPVQEAPPPDPGLSRADDGPTRIEDDSLSPCDVAAEPAAVAPPAVEALAPPDWWLAPPPEEVPLPVARRETPREVFRDFLRDQLQAGLVRRHAGPAVEREAGALIAHPNPDVDRMRSIWTAVEKAAWIERYAASGVPMPA